MSLHVCLCSIHMTDCEKSTVSSRNGVSKNCEPSFRFYDCGSSERASNACKYWPNSPVTWNAILYHLSENGCNQENNKCLWRSRNMGFLSSVVVRVCWLFLSLLNPQMCYLRGGNLSKDDATIIHLLIDDHLSWFHSLEIENGAAMNVGVHIPLW